MQIRVFLQGAFLPNDGQLRVFMTLWWCAGGGGGGTECSLAALFFHHMLNNVNDQSFCFFFLSSGWFIFKSSVKKNAVDFHILASYIKFGLRGSPSAAYSLKTHWNGLFPVCGFQMFWRIMFYFQCISSFRLFLFTCFFAIEKNRNLSPACVHKTCAVCRFDNVLHVMNHSSELTWELNTKRMRTEKKKTPDITPDRWVAASNRISWVHCIDESNG